MFDPSEQLVSLQKSMTTAQNTLLEVYEMMVRIRFCEEAFVEPITSGEILCPVHLCSGQEAIAAGVCASLEREDVVFGSHRSHGHYLAKGGNLKAMVAEVFCRETGCARGRGGSMHIIDPDVGMLGAAPIVAGTISLAVGAGLASQARNDGTVAVAFFGDGAAGEGVLYESMNLAALRRLPVIFVCENNLYSTHLPINECRVNAAIVEAAAPFGMRGIQADGNDVLRVLDLARQAVEACRRGDGPFFLEFNTYRLRGHVGPNDNIQGSRTDIRPAREIEEWRARDPIPRLELHLASTHGVTVGALDAIKTRLRGEVEDAFSYAAGLPRPAICEVTTDVFRDARA
jgi:acetoin:2,6-dichlorophenolindophenol oxidoreductase subunit alpha